MEIGVAKESLYERAVVGDPAMLPSAVRELHFSNESVRGSGVFTVVRPRRLLHRLATALMRGPKPTPATEVDLEVVRDGTTETWVRRFGDRPDRPVVTVQRLEAGRILERFGCMEFVLGVSVVDQTLCLRSDAARLRIGGRSYVVPRRMAPKAAATVGPGGDPRSVFVTVTVSAPALGKLLEYSGELRLEAGGQRTLTDVEGSE